MKHLLLTTIAAVLLVGCGESQQSAPPPEAKPVEPVAEAATPEPPTVKAPDIPLWEAAKDGNIEAVKQHLAAGADVNAKSYDEWTPLHFAALSFLNSLHDQKGIVELKSPNRNFCKGASLVNCRIFGPPFVVVNQVKIVNSEEMENRRV